MAKIEKREVILGMVEGLRLDPGRDKIPNETEDKVRVVFNPDSIRANDQSGEPINLLAVDDVNPNLRVTMYTGSAPIASTTPGSDGIDNVNQRLRTKSFGYNFNGVTWDRIRIPDARADLDRQAIGAGATVTLIAAAAGLNHRIHHLSIAVSGATVLTLDDGTTGQIYAEYEFAGAGNLIVNFPNGLLTNTVNETLDVTSSAAVNVAVHALFGNE